jgi:3-hydroxyacyl-CoA dehydrogenase
MNSEQKSEVTLTQRGDIAVLLIDNPPVNALSARVVKQLDQAVDTFARDVGTRALVVACTGRTFVAGGDIVAFDDPSFSAEPLNALLERLEALDRPVVASLHGWTFGGGLELALACHWRVANVSTQLGFPEVKLGLLPGSLGTQRAPRLIGIEAALDLIATGRTLVAQQALDCGLIDAIVEGDSVEQGIAFAQQVLRNARGVRRLSERSVDAADLSPQFFSEARARAQRERASYPAAVAIVDALEAACLPFKQGEAVEANLFEALRASSESKALRHLFFAQRAATKVAGLASGAVKREIRRVGVVGGGTMGRGITINFLNAGIPTVIVETSESACEVARRGILEVFEGNLAKARLSEDELVHRLALLEVTLDDTALSVCDLVIEAVFEDMDLKESVCRRLGVLCKPGAIIATNTSTLDVDALARATGRSQDVVGLHFFSPAHIMRLLEIVRGADTAADVLLTVVHLAQALGKVPVVCGVCWGFIGNRMLEVYLREAEFLLLEGATPEQIDSAVESLGLPMGPCRMLDLAGVDVGAKVVIEQDRSGRLPADSTYRIVVRRLYAIGRHGQKAGRGYYRYEGRKAVPDPELQEITRELADSYGVHRRATIDRQEIRDRLLLPLINEGFRLLEEGIASRASDIDLVWAHGYGFPDHLGGPMFHATTLGLGRIIERMAHFANTRGNAYGYWTPSALLQQLATTGSRLQDVGGKS